MARYDEAERSAQAVIATIKSAQRKATSMDSPRGFLIQTAEAAIEQLQQAVEIIYPYGDIASLAHFYLGYQLTELGFLRCITADEVRRVILETGTDSIPVFRDGVKEVTEAAEIDHKSHIMNSMFVDDELCWALGSVSLVVVYQSEYLAATSDNKSATAYLREFAERFFYAGQVLPYVHSKLGDNYLALGQQGEAREWYDRVAAFRRRHGDRSPLDQPSDGRPRYELVIDYAEARIENMRPSYDPPVPLKSPWGQQKPASKRWKLF